ncbi:hypothetical protein FOZ76_02115 [Verticiella sediminum]|uniref:Response regulator transcription factor n=1 Tax=Verticiella sediminum TaxID=1247510 RepID=A0A556B067_9BURK|nr:hypothetical protein [Verticiella sediminum]TSH98569.1 hypothetical protein FOZ76_02115 [Verticiella sediminum]
MNRRIDCALLMLPAFGEWVAAPWTEPLLGPVHLQVLPLCEGGGWNGQVQAQGCYAPQAAMALSRLSPALRRFDLCVLPVSPASLGWTRAALLAARGQLPVPLLLLTRQVSSGAVGDLLALGAADFMPQSARHEEIKARLLRWGVRAAPTPGLAPFGGADPASAPGDTWLLKARAQGFRATRNQVLEHFERSYVTGMLERFRGNVTHAARAGQQDRRAFWQLMRKHSILSADYRRLAIAEAHRVDGNAQPPPGWNRTAGIHPVRAPS